MIKYDIPFRDIKIGESFVAKNWTEDHHLYECEFIKTRKEYAKPVNEEKDIFFFESAYVEKRY